MISDSGKSEMHQQVRQRLESLAGTQVKDLHLWSVGQGAWTLMAIEVYHCKECGGQSS
jgi:hypothetical protein